MNFLAHMVLSCSDPDLIQGNFLADFLHNKEIRRLSQKLKNGVKLHRAIDTFTDNHPSVRACTRILHKSQGKYAPVVVDVLFDYILYRNWGKYCDMTFEAFESMIYKVLLEGSNDYPAELKDLVKEMVDDQFLSRYVSEEGLRWTFKELKKRVSFASNMEMAVDDFKKIYPDLEKHFNEFFPQLKEMAEKFCNC